MKIDNLKDFKVDGCPIFEKGCGCGRMCGGGWPGTTVSSEALTKAILNGKLNPDKLGCQPLIDRAKEGMEKLNELF